MTILATIQRTLKAPKGQFNAFGKYHYRSCEDILEAVKPLLGEAILTLTDEVMLIGDRHYVKATATFAEPDASPVIITAFAREEADKKGMDGSQITGAASSYARKYALNGLFLIDDAKDSDATNDGGKGQEQKKEAKTPPPPPPPPPPSDPLKSGSSLHKKIEAQINEAGIGREDFKAWLESVGWIAEKDGKLSLSTLSEKNAKYLVDRWDSATKTYNQWLDKRLAAQG